MVYHRHVDQRKALKQLRKHLGGMSQEALARRLNITLRTVARWESGTNPVPVSPENLFALYQLSKGDEKLSTIFRKAIERETSGISGTAAIRAQADLAIDLAKDGIPASNEIMETLKKIGVGEAIRKMEETMKGHARLIEALQGLREKIPTRNAQ